MNTIESLQALYVKLGGELTDTYEDIAGGVPVSDYSIIPDMIAAVAKKATSGGNSYVGTAETTGSAGASEPNAEFSLDITANELFALISSGKTASFICNDTSFPQSAFVINVTAIEKGASSAEGYRVQAVKTTANHVQQYKTTVVCLVGEAIAADANVTLVPAVTESVDANSET